MADQIKLMKAKSVYNNMVSSLKERNWNFDEKEEDLLIVSGIKGDDLPIEFIVEVKAEQEVVQFLSRLPFAISEDKRVDGAIAVCVANNGLICGSFDYDIGSGEIIFKLANCYKGSSLGADIFEHIIMLAASTIDNYNDKFFMLSKGAISLEDFINQENQ
ncbi:MAG: hypothetical protein IJ309_00985 [Clostridia bacterium]|nr:hypothetical protein [Clostridia bacterium]